MRSMQQILGPRVPVWLVGAVLIVVLFWLGGGTAPWLLIPYVGLVLPTLVPLPLMYGSVEAAEFMLSLGSRRSDLVRAYLRNVAGKSALHALAFTVAWSLRGFDQVGVFGLAEPALFIKVFLGLFAIQLLARSAVLLLVNAPVATCFPPAWRGCWTGDQRSSLRSAGTILAGLLLGGLLVAYVIWVIVTKDPLWLTIPAVACVGALILVVKSVEITQPTWSWEPNSKRKGRLPRVKPSTGAVRTLGWRGLRRWVWGTAALALTPAITVLIFLAIDPKGVSEDHLLIRTVWFGFAGWLLLLLVCGGKAFIWSSEGDSGETLRMAGLETSYLRRFKLVAAAAIVVAAVCLSAAAFSGPTVFERDDLAYFFARSLGGFILLGCAAHLLLWMNESPVLPWRGRTLTGVQVSEVLRGVGFLVVVASLIHERAVGRKLVDGTGSLWPVWAGLALLIPAAFLWFVGWFRASERDPDSTHIAP